MIHRNTVRKPPHNEAAAADRRIVSEITDAMRTRVAVSCVEALAGPAAEL